MDEPNLACIVCWLQLLFSSSYDLRFHCVDGLGGTPSSTSALGLGVCRGCIETIGFSRYLGLTEKRLLPRAPTVWASPVQGCLRRPTRPTPPICRISAAGKNTPVACPFLPVEQTGLVLPAVSGSDAGQ